MFTLDYFWQPGIYCRPTKDTDIIRIFWSMRFIQHLINYLLCFILYEKNANTAGATTGLMAIWVKVSSGTVFPAQSYRAEKTGPKMAAGIVLIKIKICRLLAPNRSLMRKPWLEKHLNHYKNNY